MLLALLSYRNISVCQHSCVLTYQLLTHHIDLTFVVSVGFAWKLAVIVAISALPLYIIKLIRSRIAPAASSKLL